MTTPEFSRPVSLDTIGEGARAIEVEAEAGERFALAARFGLRGVGRLTAAYRIQRRADAIYAEGRLHAEVVQRCVVSDEDVPATVDEAFAIRFFPEGAGEPVADEIELSADECDTIFYAGAAIDLGDAVAETMALALDPFPRSPGAAVALREAGVLSEGEAGPFGALAALKDKLRGQS